MNNPREKPFFQKTNHQRGQRAFFIFSLLGVGYFLVYFHRLCPAIVALDLMKAFDTGGAMLGLLGSAYFYPYAIMQLPAGLLADSWGPRKSVSLFLTIAALGSLLFGLAPNFEVAVLARVLVGLGASMVFIPTMKILALWFQPRQFVHLTGILMVMGGLGSLSAATPLAWFSRVWGWRLSFIGIGLVTLLLILLIWRFIRDHPEDLSYPPIHQIDPLTPGKGLSLGLFAGVKQVLGHGYFWPLAVWYFFTGGIFFSFVGLWGGPYLMQVYGLDKGLAAHILSLSAVAMMFGSPCFSLLSDKVLKSRKQVLIGSSLMMVLTTVPLAFFTESLSVSLLYGVCLGMGFFSAAVVSIVITATKELFPETIAGTSTGLVNLFPFLGGAIFQPLTGLLLEAGGMVSGAYPVSAYQRAFTFYFLCALGALLIIFFMKETFPKKILSPPPHS